MNKYAIIIDNNFIQIADKETNTTVSITIEEIFDRFQEHHDKQIIQSVLEKIDEQLKDIKKILDE